MQVNYGQLFLQIARRFGDKEAVVNLERNRRYSFRQFHKVTNRVARMIGERLGLGPGDVYLNILENDSMSLLSFPTLFKSNQIGAWANFRDSTEEHLRMVDFVKAKAVFIERALLDKYYTELCQRGVKIVVMDPLAEARAGVYYFWDLVESVSDDELGIELDPDGTSLYRFTGGTTGQGKCCIYSPRNWMATLQYIYCFPAENFFDPSYRHLTLMPLSHASSLFMLWCWFKGVSHLTMNVPDLKGFCANVQAEKVSSTMLVPTVLYRFLEVDLHQMYDLSSLKKMFYGASPMNPEKLKGLQTKFGNIFVQAYGASETLAPVSLLATEDHVAKTPEEEKRLSSAGAPVANAEIRVMGPNGRELPSGEIGEFWIRSEGTIRGYYQNPEATQAEFENGFWKSGDMGYRDEHGYLYIVDRKKDMIITGGFNVYAGEVEAALLSHPSVTNAVAVGIPHAEWGEAVHAEVVLKPGATLSAEELISFCKERIGFKAPKSVSFVEKLPMTPIGKVLRFQVRAKYWEGRKRNVN